MRPSLLSPAETHRYQRQIILPEIGVAGQEKLKRARVLVVGAGGLGCPVLSYLVCTGVGLIKVADGDSVDLSNLHRQPLFDEGAVGSPKVEVAARLLREKNSKVEIFTIPCRIDAQNVRELLADVDIVVDGSDNFATKYLLNDACVELGKTLVSGSIFCFEGQVSVFNAPLGNGRRGPTYRCLFPEPPVAGLIPSCAEAGVLGVLPGVVGSLQATEVVKLILEIGEVLAGSLLVFDAMKMSFAKYTFDRDEQVVSATKIRPAAYYRALSGDCAEAIKTISVGDLRQMMERREDVQLVDVREPEEKAEFDLGGELIPRGELLAEAQRIPRDRPVVLYCRTGVRSANGVAELEREFGYSNLYNLDGGILAWQREVGQYIPSYGGVSRPS